ncbi:hypothetical protein GIB67_035367 [Kingdonia uniflora]|uniref:Dof zinc finger protein n=1 Tax=Kingdonia uniflora TaxID=39325 RepID=A0A7J7MMJ0_9MAGN|nr:hypothetical protein GIB67_035367 [Kingdonia uniflora]
MFTQREDYLPLPPRPSAVDRRWKPNVEIAPNCPRCNSSNTKFCYYNNYSLTQPRYFCKSCRRYWTKGGSLRNVPIGGGCRKNRRGKSGRTVTTSDHVYTRSSSTYGNSSGGTLTTHEGSIRNPYLSEGDLNLNRNTGVSDSSNIDLAVVYAKFLNQGTDSDPGEALPSLISHSSETV